MKNHQAERDELVLEYHVTPGPGGLKCPLCGRWSPLDFSSPQGVRLTCTATRGCGTVTIMPRVQLVRAIKRHTV